MSHDSNLWASETYINKTKGYSWGDSEPYETWTDNVGKLFLSMQREHGRCTGRAYIDKKDGAVQQVGWVFEKIDKYEDTGEPYLREVWVNVWKVAPTLVPRHWEGGEYAFEERRYL